MIIVLKPQSTKQMVDNFVDSLQKNYDVKVNEWVGTQSTVLGLIGDTSAIDIDYISAQDIVESVKRVQEPYKKANRKFHPDDTVITLPGGQKIGDGSLSLIAGPCSVESERQIVEIAKSVKDSGAQFLRGGAFKPRTSPYAFQGLKAEGLELLREARKVTGLPIVTEIMRVSHIPLFEDVDIIQVGACLLYTSHGVTLLPVKLPGAEEGARGFFPANHRAPLIIQLGQIPPGVNNIFVMVAEQRLRGGTDAEPLGKLLLAAVGHPGHLRSEALHVVLFLLKQALGDKQRHRHVFVTKLFKLMV